jgi:hypothetical protein
MPVLKHLKITTVSEIMIIMKLSKKNEHFFYK